MSLSSYILNALSLRQKIVIILLFSSVMLGIVSVCIMRSEWIFSLLCGCLSYILLMIVTFQSIRTKITQKIQEADTEEKLLKYASKYDDDTQDITQKVISQDSKHNLKTTESMQTQNEAVQHNENLESCHIERSEISNTESKQSKDSIDTNSSLSPNIQNSTNSPKTTENTESNPNTKQSKKEKSKERLKLLDLSKASLGFELSFSLPRIFVFIGMIVCCVVLVWFRAFYPLVYLFGVFLGVVIIMCFLLMKRWHDDFMQNSHKHDTKSCKTC
ncbi:MULTISPECIES: hypothetical protein [Helicobacter]|uniref:Uncharacterized protein n=1 Tax=Helicobacter bilis ATCC 43879 TaxID=613026 RepID=C3XGX4_9HELI|nr:MULTISPECIES: hypothetical protein [Helicobacter]EEO24263.1 hypothetical protein HRAG_01320 [Helicobacter bilis ATCC 43879]